MSRVFVRPWILLVSFLIAQNVGAIAFTTAGFDSGRAYEQTFAPAFLTGGDTAELVVVNVSEDNARELIVFGSSRDGWRPRLRMPLDEAYIFFDVVTIGRSDRLMLYRRGALDVLDLQTGRTAPWLAVDSIYNAPMVKAFRRTTLAQDVNGDDREDLLIPDFDGYWVFLQAKDGTFTRQPKFGRSVTMAAAFDEAPSYDLRTAHRMDYNTDGRTDLAFWHRGRFEVHVQNDRGGFAVEPTILEIPIPLEHDDVFNFMADDDEAGGHSKKALYAVDDLNGDGVTDLETFSVAGQGVFGRSTAHQVHLGRRDPENGMSFDVEPQSTIGSEGFQFYLEHQDFDSDGAKDVLVVSVEFGLAKIIAALLTQSASLDIEFYRMTPNGYDKKPNAKRKITAQFDYSSGNVFVPAVMVGDFTGDTLADLAVQEGDEGLRVFPGVRDERLFDKRGKLIEVAMPDDRSKVHMLDLNRDDKKDVLLHFDSRVETNRLTVLMAQ